MTTLIIFGVLAAASFLVLAFYFIKKYPQLRMLAPESAIEVRDKRKKKEIIRGRLERAGGVYASYAKKYVAAPIGGVMQRVVRTVAGRLTAAERVYKEKQKIQQAKDITPDQLLVWVEEGRVLLQEGDFEKAEKKLIEVIGLDARCVPAYELLGQVYLKRKDYQLAEETFRFLLKLAKEDASVNAYMGEVLDARDRKEEALTFYEKAVELSPRNPRYLDFFISSALELKNRDLAEKGVLLLKDSNPENQKIATFEEEIAALS